MIGDSDLARRADEYVLGLLDEEETRRFDAEIDRDPAARQAVAVSRERFLPLDLSTAAVPVTPSLWDRIDAGLQAGQETTVRGESPIAVPSNDNRIVPWKRTAIASLAASVLLAVGLSWSLMQRSDPVVVAILVNDAGEPQAIVEDFSNKHATIRLLADFPVPEGKTMQVWTLPNRETGPVSLGLLDQHRSAQLSPPALPKPQDDQLYEITLEQTGGSPTGKPTGPILVKGFARAPR